MKLPTNGLSKDEVVARMEAHRRTDADWRGGKTFSLIYNAGADVTEVLDEAARMFLHTNALSFSAFPSLRRFEAEILAISADLFGAPDAAGSLTSGGTESICMAVKTARDLARAERPSVTRPQMIVPATIHPAFHKAAHYFDVQAVVVPVGPDFRVPPEAVRAALTDDTVMIVGSAPCFPFGVIDPIPELAAIAAERGILMHVDACVGGYFLPFLERLGEAVPPWDFRVPGVTSISADVHKYGFASKGASVVLYRSRELRRKQFFAYVDWPGGLYASPAMAGSRGGAPIAGAWAVLNFLGERGFVELARRTMATTRRILDGVRAIPGLSVMGAPSMSIFAFTSQTLDIYGIGELLEGGGWRIDRQQLPPSLHLMVSPAHEAVAGKFLEDLAAAARSVEGRPPANEGMAAMYGMLATLPDRSAVSRVVLDFLDSFDRI
ncbi:MAG: aspartate aminotransferase family protein [Myxococcales bacterium]|nr:aspartate aminotransferase family protein [Myxococcales bacterium]